MKRKLDKAAIIAVLKDMAVLMELNGENPFACRAHSNAARVLETLEEDFDQWVRDQRLDSLKGIGKALAEKITALYCHGTHPTYEALRQSVPQGLLEILQLPGLGPKKAKRLYDELKIESMGELEYACKENRLLKLDGFGEKSQEKLLQAIQFYKRNRSLHLYADALAIAEAFVQQLKQSKSVELVEIAGSLRRKKEIVQDIDLVVATKYPEQVMKEFVALPMVDQVVAQGGTKSSIIANSGIQIDLRCVTSPEFPHTLQHFTGSKEHNITLRAHAKQLGLKINEYGLHRGKKNILCDSEREIYQRLGLHFIPPELREDRGELEYFRTHEQYPLIEYGDIKGAFHIHTTYSDGAHSVEQMAKAAQAMGLHYIGLSDHSQSAFYANGMKVDDVERQRVEIDRVNQKQKSFFIFKGVESDILADGLLDYPTDVLQTFDFVIASVHSRFKMNRDEMTQRIERALQNPHTTMLGHMTGRLLLSRDGYELDVARIIDVAADQGRIIELNANPHRLDIDWRHLDYARKKGVKFAINPDAHRIEGIAAIDFGVGVARKGWLTKDDVINTLGLTEMRRYLQSIHP